MDRIHLEKDLLRVAQTKVEEPNQDFLNPRTLNAEAETLVPATKVEERNENFFRVWTHLYTPHVAEKTEERNLNPQTPQPYRPR